MKGAKIGLGAIAILIALLVPIKADAQALPELPAETLSQLQLVQSNAQGLAMASEGINVYDNSSANILANLALFGSLYRMLQSWNNWIGGDDYQVTRAYVMERTDLPEWLANYAGDVIFWELEYFGHTIEMLTDQDGYILNREDDEPGKVEPAVNCRIKHEMIEAVEKYKVENPDKNQALVVESFSKSPAGFTALKSPHLEGKTLVFYVSVNGAIIEYKITNFVNAIMCVETTQYTGVFVANLFKVGGVAFSDMEVYKNGVKQNLSNITSVSWQYMGTHSGPFTISNYLSWGLGQYGDKISMIYPACYDRFNPTSSNRRNVYNNNANVISNNSVAGYPPIGDIFLSLKSIREVTNNQAIENIENKPISSNSLQEISDAIAQIQPQTDPQTGIEIMPLPQEFPLPEAVPLEQEEPAPPIPPGIEDFPQSDPSQVPSQNPSIDPGTEPTNDPLPDSAEEIQPMEELQLVTGLQNRFPFSIPWDIYNAYKMLQAQREIPHWEWDMVVNLPGGGVFTHTFVLDLEFIDPVVSLFRDLFLLAFILGLAIYSYNKFFGGGA